MNKTNNNQSGNVLFLVLIAVALFAALSYAVTQSTRGGGDSDSEANLIQSTEIINYLSSLSQAITRMQVIKGCSDTEINFNYDSDGDGIFVNDAGDLYNNTGSPSDMSCHLFHPNGGGMYYNPLSKFVPASSLHGGIRFFGTRAIENIGTVAPELIAYLHVSPDICNNVNDELGITQNIDNYAGGAGVLFVGTYTLVASIGDESNANSLPAGLSASCLERPADPDDIREINYVLIER
jgi:hypothetical protein